VFIKAIEIAILQGINGLQDKADVAS